MINGSGHPAGQPVIPLMQETTMLKAISAALLAVSVLAAPALAANPGKAAQATEIKTAPLKQAKSTTLNANAKMVRHHRHFRHHRLHQQIGARKMHHHASKLTSKHMRPTTKHG
jgi:hypothetical protein